MRRLARWQALAPKASKRSKRSEGAGGESARDTDKSSPSPAELQLSAGSMLEPLESRSPPRADNNNTPSHSIWAEPAAHIRPQANLLVQALPVDPLRATRPRKSPGVPRALVVGVFCRMRVLARGMVALLPGVVLVLGVLVFRPRNGWPYLHLGIMRTDMIPVSDLSARAVRRVVLHAFAVAAHVHCCARSPSQPIHYNIDERKNAVLGNIAADMASLVEEAEVLQGLWRHGSAQQASNLMEFF